MIRPLKFGICLDGCEADMERLIKLVCQRFKCPLYMEIGVAYGNTLASMASILASNSESWVAVGVELPNGYSLNRNFIEMHCGLQSIPVRFVEDANGFVLPAQNSATIYLKDSQKFLPENWMFPVHFAFIDGCHGKPCVKADFIALEKFIPPGGIVVFHDFGQDSVGQPQVHCQTADVPGACAELGLTNGNLPGWKYLGSVVGDKGKNGMDIGIFERPT